MIINVPILTNGVGLFADLTRMGLGNVQVTLKPNFNMPGKGRPHVEGFAADVDLHCVNIHQSQHQYDLFLVVVTGQYKGFQRRLLNDEERAVIPVNDFIEYFHVLVNENGMPKRREIDLKSIYELKDQLYFHTRDIY